jgi:hypothetical protein
MAVPARTGCTVTRTPLRTRTGPAAQAVSKVVSRAAGDIALGLEHSVTQIDDFQLLLHDLPLASENVRLQVLRGFSFAKESPAPAVGRHHGSRLLLLLAASLCSIAQDVPRVR